VVPFSTLMAFTDFIFSARRGEPQPVSGI
jgi:hypothetical protein